MNDVAASGIFRDFPHDNWPSTEMFDYLERCHKPHQRRARLDIISPTVFESSVAG
jgi:hypothetical protein